MIIVMEPKATEEQIQAVVHYLESHEFRAVLNRGDIMTVIAAIGDKVISTSSGCLIRRRS